MNSVDSAISSVVAAKQSALSSQISTAVAAKQLQATKQQGDSAVQLIENAAAIGKEAGKGAVFDGSA